MKYSDIIQKLYEYKDHNQAFKAWFNGSKVVDNEGKPLVMFHGTTTSEDFTKFKSLSHFGSNKAANDRLDNVLSIHNNFPKKHDTRGRILPVYLSIKNPLEIIDDGGLGDVESFIAAAKEVGAIDDNEVQKIYNAIAYNTSSVLLSKALIKILSDKGYDGFKYINTVEDAGSVTYVPFRSSQIKSIFAKDFKDSENISESTLQMGYGEFREEDTTIKYRFDGQNIGISLIMTDMGKEGKGSSRRALSKLLKIAKDNSYNVYLTPVATEKEVDKSRLVDFYKSLGFVKNIRPKNYYELDTIPTYYTMKLINKDSENISESVKILTNDLLSKELKEYIKYFGDEYGEYDPKEINNGHCYDFAGLFNNYLEEKGYSLPHNLDAATDDFILNDDEDVDVKKVKKHIKLPSDIDSDLLINSIFTPGTHCWIEFNGKKYDAEETNGVSDLLQLPFFKRIVNSVREYQKNHKSENISESEEHQTFYHVTPTKNLRNILKNGLKPSIGDLSNKASETENMIYLFPSEEVAEDAIMNWMGDEYEDEQLSLLKIDLPSSISVGSNNEWEWFTKQPIPAKYITIEQEEI